MTDEYDIARELAEAHVEWFLKAIRPLLVDHMVHGFKHGIEYRQQKFNQEIQPTEERG